MSVWNKIGTRHTGPRYLGDKGADYRGSVNVEPCWTFKIVPQEAGHLAGVRLSGRLKHPELVPDETGKATVADRSTQPEHEEQTRP